ncbi:CHAD domain-containing protein [Paraconexibacter sp. AEG42_29]
MSKSPGDGLRRCADSQLQGARDGLVAVLENDDGVARAEAIHSARKSVKKTRALVRLARPAIGEKRYRKANASLREAGGTLSGARDADVMLDVIADLRESGVGQLPAAAFDALQAAVAADGGGDAATAAAGAGDALPVAIERLDAAAARVGALDLSGMTWSTVLDSLTLSYARGHAELAAVAAAPTVEARHDWRKRAKDRWYQERLISGAWEPLLSAEADELHLLSEYLGDDHDLAVLRAAITSGSVEAPIDTDAVLDLIDDRREELLHDALLLGRRLYAERPKAFRRRMREYVRVWDTAQQDALVEV